MRPWLWRNSAGITSGLRYPRVRVSCFPQSRCGLLWRRIHSGVPRDRFARMDLVGIGVGHLTPVLVEASLSMDL